MGSYAYNAAMTLGAAALVRLIRPSMVAMLVCLAAVIAMALRRHQLGRVEGRVLLALYPAFVLFAVVA